MHAFTGDRRATLGPPHLGHLALVGERHRRFKVAKLTHRCGALQTPPKPSPTTRSSTSTTSRCR